jgi:predicted nucleic acid-binding protein
MLYYLDSSAIVKLYIEEAGSGWLEGVVVHSKPDQLFISALAGIEVLSALTRRFRANDIPEQDYQIVRDEFLMDYQNLFTQISITSKILSDAMILISKYYLRAYDSLQLATAIELQEIIPPGMNQEVTFICADKQLLDIAQKEGLNIENPDLYF